MTAASAGAIALLSLAGCSIPTASTNPISRQGTVVNNLYGVVMVLSFLVFLVVAGLLVIIMVRFRARPDSPEPRQVVGNRRLEIGWTAGAVLLLVVLFTLSVRTLITVQAAEPGALEVRAIGHQWWWEYQYPAQNLVTANELHIPTGSQVHLSVESADVAHAFWVPQLGWQKDAIPGQVNDIRLQVDNPGTVDGACDQYCGTEHAWMRIRVVAQSPTDFQTWVQGQTTTPAAPTTSDAQHGQQVFLQNTCVSCHTIAGTGADAQVGPNLTHFGSRTILGGGVLDNTPENLTRWVQNAQAIKPGVLMPAFRSLSPDDARALAAYLEGLK